MIYSILLYSVLSIAFAASAYHIYKLFQKLKLANWARKNKTQARWLLVSFNLAMGLIGVSLGLLCAELDLQLGTTAIYIGVGIFLTATILFPNNDKSSRNIASRYKRKQILSAMRIGGSALALITFSNHFMGASGESMLTEAGVHPAVLIVLASIGFLVFGALILLLSCGIACNGYEGAAIMVLMGGGIGLITLYVFIIRKIINRDKKTGPVSPATSNESDLLDDSLLEN